MVVLILMLLQHNEKSFSLKTMEDGQVLLHSVSIIPAYLVFFNLSHIDLTLFLVIYKELH